MLHNTKDKLIIKGTVQTGQNIGHTIGFPTANLDTIPSETDLKPGVYAATCQLSSSNSKQVTTHKCLAYFGPRYVLNQTKNVFEVYIYDFDQNIYHHQLSIHIGVFIRPPKKIKSLDELKKQITMDKEKGRQLLLSNEI